MKSKMTAIVLLGALASGAPAATVLDDGDAGVDTTGWSSFSNSAEFNGDQKYVNDGGAAVASYTFSGISNGWFDVFAQWREQSNRSTNVEYTITGYGSADIVISGVNQRNAPTADLTLNDTNSAGTLSFPFQQLGRVTVSTNTVTLQVRDNDGTGANTFAIADAAAIEGVQLDTVDWTSGASGTGNASGTLGGATVTIDSSAPQGNAGLLFGNSWASQAGTNGALPGGVTFNDAVAIGAGTVSVDVVNSRVVDPILLFNFGEDNVEFDFGSLAFNLLDANNATVAGSVVTIGVGANNTANDGFAVQLLGTYTDFSFTYTGTGTAGFSFGGVTVPAPAALPAGLAMLGLAAARRRRRHA